MSLEATTFTAPAVAPDVGAIFEYAFSRADDTPSTFRVDSWLRVRPQYASAYDMTLSGAMMDEAGGRSAVIASMVIQEILSEEGPRPDRMEFCARDLATHVGGSGICGCIAPLSKIRVIGTVEWSEERVAQQRRRAERLGADHELVY